MLMSRNVNNDVTMNPSKVLCHFNCATLWCSVKKSGNRYSDRSESEQIGARTGTHLSKRKATGINPVSGIVYVVDIALGFNFFY